MPSYLLVAFFCLAYFRDNDARHSIFGICHLEYLWYEKKKIIHIIKNLFILLLKKETFKHTTINDQFLLLFQCNILCALMLWTSKHLPWLLYIFFFTCFSISLILFFSSILFFCIGHVFWSFLKGRADWLSIFIGWKCLYSSKET